MVAVCSLKVRSSSDTLAAHNSWGSRRKGMERGTYRGRWEKDNRLLVLNMEEEIEPVVGVEFG